eukprot:COSAG06_NODE_54451_length_294_cov_1.056410_1_plen_41_part_10
MHKQARAPAIVDRGALLRLRLRLLRLVVVLLLGGEAAPHRR